jgi:hypothetical protein
MPHVNLSKTYFLGQEIEKKMKIAIHMDLWKYGQNLTNQKSLIIKQLSFSKKKFSYEFNILY